MTNITIQETYGGWKHASTPDDIDLRIEDSRDTQNLTLPLVDIVLLYDRVTHTDADSLTLGVGHQIEIRFPSPSTVAIESSQFTLEASQEEVVAAFETALETVFRRKDALDSAKERDSTLDSMGNWLRRRDCTVDPSDVQRNSERVASSPETVEMETSRAPGTARMATAKSGVVA